MADHRPILLVSYPRTASHLLMLMLSVEEQPNIVTNDEGGYHFFPVLHSAWERGFWETSLSQWGDEAREMIHKTAHEAFASLERTRAAGDAEGGTVFNKEHAAFLMDPNVVDEWLYGPTEEKAGDLLSARRWRLDGAAAGSESPREDARPFSPLNGTMLSDAYLRQWRMVFLIRHPALAMPSMYRVMKAGLVRSPNEKNTRNLLAILTTTRWSRMLYDLAQELDEGHREPLLLDADDIISNPSLVAKVAAELGMDPKKSKATWSPLPPEEYEKLTPMQKRMRVTLNASGSVIKDRMAGDVDMAVEVAKWTAEFGAEDAKILETAVTAAMPDYLYLRSKRLTA